MSDKDEIKIEAQENFHVKSTSNYNILIIGIASLGGFVAGFAGNAIAGTLAQTSFDIYFLAGDNATQIIGGTLGIFSAGALIGGVIHAQTSKSYGRRVTTATAAVVLILSGALQAGSVHYAMFITARGICGIGFGMIIANCPVYMNEISPPHTRGLLAGLHGVAVILGSVVCAAASLGFHYVAAPIQWRLEYIVLILLSFLLLISILFIPESPRWLIANGKSEEAWGILKRLRASRNDPNANFARAEMIQIKVQINAERKEAGSKGYLQILRTPSLRKRALCSILVWVMAQSTGVLVILNLAPLIFRTLGYGTVLQLALSLAWIACSLIGCIVNVLIMDRFGRVKLLVTGGYLCTASLIVEAVLQRYYINTTYQPGLNAAVAFFFIFIVCYSCLIDCTAYVYNSEIWPTHLRSQGTTIGMVSFFLTAIAYTSPASLAFENIGWKYYLVFISVCVITTTAIAFIFPETAGLTLEEIGAEFGDSIEIRLADIQPTGGEDATQISRESIPTAMDKVCFG